MSTRQISFPNAFSTSSLRAQRSNTNIEQNIAWDTTFHKEYLKELNDTKAMNLYDQLILIAPAHINGLIQENLSQQVRKFVMSHIHKDYMHLNEKEILSSIQVEVTKLKRLAP